MNLLADEGVDRQIVERLRRDGHAVWYVAEMVPGINDDAVLQRAADQAALLVTEDKDFGELVYRQQRAHHGVILLRLAGLDSPAKAELVAHIVSAHGAEIPQSSTVIAKSSVRIRKSRA